MEWFKGRIIKAGANIEFGRGEGEGNYNLGRWKKDAKEGT